MTPLRTSIGQNGKTLVHGYLPEKFGAREITVESDHEFVARMQPVPVPVEPPADVPPAAASEQLEESASTDAGDDSVAASTETSAPASATTPAEVGADAAPSPSEAHVTHEDVGVNAERPDASTLAREEVEPFRDIHERGAPSPRGRRKP